MDTPNGTPGASTTPADAARRVKDTASDVIGRTKQAALTKANEGVQQISSAATSATSALRRAADDVAGENDLIGNLLRSSADTIERTTRSLSDGDISRLVDDVNGFARRQPAVFLGVSLLVGFALARVGKTILEQNASEPEQDYAGTQLPGL